MNDLANFSFEKLSKVYQKYFSLGYINDKFENKIAIIAMICYVTNAIRKQGKNVTCYDILLKIGSDFNEDQKKTFLKSLAVICDDMMYGCKEFPDFGVKPKDMPAQIKQILSSYCPF